MSKPVIDATGRFTLPGYEWIAVPGASIVDGALMLKIK